MLATEAKDEEIVELLQGAGAFQGAKKEV